MSERMNLNMKDLEMVNGGACEAILTCHIGSCHQHFYNNQKASCCSGVISSLSIGHLQE